MMRVCHLDTCPVGVATQNPELRKKFSGKPEFVVNFFEFIAEEVREHLAALGFRSIEEAIGQVEMLDVHRAVEHWKARGLDLSPILAAPVNKYEQTMFCSKPQDHGLDKALDRQLIADAREVLETGEGQVRKSYAIRNTNRTVGTMLGSELTRRFGGEGMPDGTIDLSFQGSAGQSFGAFVPRGMVLRLEGDANDYLGKGLSGGTLVVRPARTATFVAEENIIAGNVILYGATGGNAFIRGLVGERFCVRNSGATAVVEGVGDHGCEYMTGGTVVVLGMAGRNFAAGMSGGIAYVLDEGGGFTQRCNPAMVELEPIPEEDRAAFDGATGELETHGKVAIDHIAGHDDATLKGLVQRHLLYTGSERARRILENWAAYLPKFVKVMPVEYRRALGEMANVLANQEPPPARVEVRAND